MQIVGGMEGAIHIWEAAVIPSLLNNSGTWTGISEEGSSRIFVTWTKWLYFHQLGPTGPS